MSSVVVHVVLVGTILLGLPLLPIWAGVVVVCVARAYYRRGSSAARELQEPTDTGDISDYF